MTDEVKQRKEIHYSFSKYSRAKDCQLKFYDAHIKKQPESNPAHDNRKSYVGIMVQHIFEALVSKAEEYDPLFNIWATDVEQWNKNFAALCDLIDKDLKLLWPFIRPLSEFEHDFDTQEKFDIARGVHERSEGKHTDRPRLLATSTLCAVDMKDYVNEFQAANSVIKEIRELYKKPLHSFLSQFSLHDIQCEVKRNDIRIELDLPAPYNEYTVVMKGELDFLWRAPASARYPDTFIIDGKKSLGSFLDPVQLKFYTIMEGYHQGDWLNARIRSCFWGWKEDKYQPDHPYMFTAEERRDLVIDIIDTHRKMENHKGESDYIPTPSFGACMFCDRRDNCLARGTSKDDIDEI